jgi:hypothetical protein
MIIEGIFLPQQMLNEGLVRWLLDMAKKLGKAALKTVASCLQHKGYLGASVLSNGSNPGHGCRALEQDIDQRLRAMPRNDPNREILEKAKRSLATTANQFDQLSRFNMKAALEVAQKMASTEASYDLRSNNITGIYARAGQVSDEIAQELARCIPLAQKFGREIGDRVAGAINTNPQIKKFFDDTNKSYAGKLGEEMGLLMATVATDERFSLAGKPVPQPRTQPAQKSQQLPPMSSVRSQTPPEPLEQQPQPTNQDEKELAA